MGDMARPQTGKVAAPAVNPASLDKNVRYYLAGMLDSRGHISVMPQPKGKGRPRPVIAVDTKDREVVDWLLKYIGGWEAKPTGGTNGKPVNYRWRMTGQPAARLANNIKVLLKVERKKAQAEACSQLLKRHWRVV